MSLGTSEESSTVTGSPGYRLKHKWTIKDFASTYLNDSLDNPQIFSTMFSSSLDGRTNFRLILWPRGKDAHHQTDLYLGLEMTRFSTSPLFKPVDIKYKLSLLNERKEECHSKEVQLSSDSRDGGVIMHNASVCFLKHSTLQEPANGLLPNDTLTLLAQIDVSQETSVPLPNLPLGGRLQLKSIESLRASLVELLYTGEHSDVVLVVEGQEFRAHKALLSAGSSVFREMFRESEDGKVILADLEASYTWPLLEFIYTGQAVNLELFAEELLVAADKYGVTQLKEQCAEVLCRKVDTDTAARLFALADRYSLAQLKSVTVEYIRANLEEVMTNSDDLKPVYELFVDALRLLKLKEEGEGDDTEEEGQQEMPQEESESIS